MPGFSDIPVLEFLLIGLGFLSLVFTIPGTIFFLVGLARFLNYSRSK